MTLTELSSKSDIAAEKIKANKDPIAEFQRRYEAARSAELTGQMSAVDREHRLEKIRKIGFPEVQVKEMVRLMHGRCVLMHWSQSTVDTIEVMTFRRLAWIPLPIIAIVADVLYLSTLDRATTPPLLGVGACFGLAIAIVSLIAMIAVPDKQYTIGEVNDLLTPMPLGVMLRLKELKDAKLFDEFLVIAPSDYMLRQSDPVLVGVIGPRRRNLQRLFFIALWK